MSDWEKVNRGAVNIEVADHLKAAVESGHKLRVKLGIDPSSPDIHLGHAVVLGKLRDFQDLGHTAVLIIGDFTAQVGWEAPGPHGIKHLIVCAFAACEAS